MHRTNADKPAEPEDVSSEEDDADSVEEPKREVKKPKAKKGGRVSKSVIRKSSDAQRRRKVVAIQKLKEKLQKAESELAVFTADAGDALVDSV